MRDNCILCEFAIFQHLFLFNTADLDEGIPKSICSMFGIHKLKSIGYNTVLIA